MVLETKLDKSFIQGQFKISGFSRAFRHDRKVVYKVGWQTQNDGSKQLEAT